MSHTVTSKRLMAPRGIPNTEHSRLILVMKESNIFFNFLQIDMSHFDVALTETIICSLFYH